MIRLVLAVCGALVAFVGHDMHLTAAVAVGLVGCLPALLSVVSWPASGRAGFVLSAVVAGLVLSAYGASQAGPVDAGRPAPVACTVTVHQ